MRTPNWARTWLSLTPPQTAVLTPAAPQLNPFVCSAKQVTRLSIQKDRDVLFAKQTSSTLFWRFFIMSSTLF